MDTKNTKTIKLTADQINYGMICKTHVEVTDDAVVLYEDTVDDGIRITKESTILTKEAFIECYNKWILGNNGGTDDGK